MNSINTKPSARADGFVLIEIHVASQTSYYAVGIMLF